MRPLKLEVQGFTAFRDLQTIVLRDLDLFVITGPTGAGKSSLLDAMVFALFGKVPRMGSQGLSDLISHGIAEARISLEFTIDAALYRVARRLPRRGATSATFEKSDGAAWASDVEGSGVRAVDRRVIELVKLDFDAFTRAVVLPQGEFQRFLRGEADKRREVLTDLLGLNIYDRMGQRARARVRELDARTRITQEILGNQYAGVTAERVAELQTDAKSSATRATQLAAALVAGGELDNQAAGLRRGREALAGRLEGLGGTRTDLVQKLRICEQAQLREQELELASDNAKRRVERTQADLTNAKETCEALIERHGTLVDIAGAQAAVEALTESRSDLDTQEGQLATLDSELAELVTQSRSADEEAAKLNAESETAKERLAQAEREAGSAAEEAADLARRVETADQVQAEVGEAAHDVERHDVQLGTARTQAERSKLESEQAENECERLAQEHTAAALADGLKAGDSCPVCHRVLEQDPDVDQHVSEALAAASGRRDEQRAAAEAAWHALAVAETSAKTAVDRLERAKGLLAEVLQGIDEIDALRSRAAKASSTKLEAAEQQVHAQRAAQEAAERQADARVEAGKLTTALANKTAEKRRLTGSCVELRKRAERATQTLQKHFEGVVPADGETQLEARRKSLDAATLSLAAAQEDAAGAQKELQTALTALADLRTELTRLGAEIAVLRRRCEALSEQLTEEFAVVDYQGKLESLPESSDDRRTHIGDLSAWCDRTAESIARADAEAEKTLGDLDAALQRIAAEHKIEVQARESVSSAVRAAAQAAREAMVRAEGAVSEAERRLGERHELERSIATAQTDAGLLRSLAAELRADRFIQYIIQQTLDLLAVRASEQLLRISADRYSLISDDGEFAVIDHANADETRSVKTLSGGETFLASLALALALSQHIGELATEGLGAKLEAVFIDEGFGALDPDTLEDVIDALERLRESNLMVGVITHVPALAERIRGGIRVEKGQNKSTVMDAASG